MLTAWILLVSVKKWGTAKATNKSHTVLSHGSFEGGSLSVGIVTPSAGSRLAGSHCTAPHASCGNGCQESPLVPWPVHKRDAVDGNYSAWKYSHRRE